MSAALKLLLPSAPEHATLENLSLHLRGLFPSWLALAILIGAAVGVWFLYQSERGSISRTVRLIMAGLRIAALGWLLLLLLRPVLVAEYRGERPRPIAVLIDNSQSMTQRDHRLTPVDRARVAISQGQLGQETDAKGTGAAEPAASPISHDLSRAQIVRNVLENPRLRLLPRLQERGPLEVRLFGERLHSPVESPAAIAEAFQANEPKTALADALAELLASDAGALPAACVVVTDGADNSSAVTLANAARASAQLGVPLHIYGVGSADAGILQLEGAEVADTLFFDDTVAIPISWRARGFKEGSVAFTVRLGNEVVAEKTVQAREGDHLQEVLSFVPRKTLAASDAPDLTITIAIPGNDRFQDRLVRRVRLLDRRVRVLVIDDMPRWQYKFLQNALLRDRRVEASFLLASGDPLALKSGPPFVPQFPARDKLFAYDLLILGDVPSSWLGETHLTWIRDFVREGGGLVLIAGRLHAPASYLGSPLAEVFPLEFRPMTFPAEDARPEAYQAMLTPAGRRESFLALADTSEESERLWKTLPGFYWNYPAAKLRPGAVTLLQHPTQKIMDQPMPILASQLYGKGQVLALTTDETWRWRYNAGERHFGRFWGQVVYQLGLPHLLRSAQRAQLALEQPQPTLGRPCTLYARLFDEEYRPLRDAQVTATLEAANAAPGEEKRRPLVLQAVPGQPGEFRALLANDRPGQWTIRLNRPEAVSLPYRVSLPPAHELEPVLLAEEALREAARLSGGQFYREEDLNRLPEAIQPRQASFTVRQETLLWNPLALVLFLSLVTAEWIVRKISHLS